MTVQFHDIVEMISAVAWPIVVIVLGLVFRRQLWQLIRGISGRVSKVSAAGISLELVAAVQLDSQQQNAVAALREPTETAPFSSSGGKSLTQLIRQGPGADFAVIDLGIGDRWLTSRLYLFAQVLHRFLGVKTLVFVRDSNDVARIFSGLAEPQAVTGRLGSRFKWLEEAYLGCHVSRTRLWAEPLKSKIQALLEKGPPAPDFSNQAVVIEALSAISREALEPLDWSNGDQVGNFVASFLNDAHLRRPASTPTPEAGWVRLDPPPHGGAQYDEHAEWITGEPVLRRVLGPVLSLSAYIERPADASEAEVAKSAATSKERYIALVDRAGRFLRLIDVAAAKAATAGG